MLIKTHLAFAALFALIYLSYFNTSNQILFLLLVLFGAMLPDVDHPKSTLGKYVKPVGWIFKHRGVFHSVFALPLLAILLSLIFKTSAYSMPLLLGYFSHLLGDALSKEGIKPFTPIFSWTLRFGWFRVGSAVEWVILGIILVFDAYLLVQL